LDLDETVAFHDAGVSAFRGKNIEVGKLREFLDMVEAGDIEAGSWLLIENLDRLSRAKPRRAARVLEDICEAGITVATLQDGHVYTEADLDDMGLILALLMARGAHEQSVSKGERLKRTWANKRAQAKRTPLTKTCPAWMRLDAERGKFSLIPERAKIVKRIFQQTLQGLGQYTVTAHLNRERVPVFGRGKHWHRSYVNKILTSPATYGVMVAYSHITDDSGNRTHTKEAEVKKYYPAVIDRETFDRVQVLIEKRTPGGRKQKASGDVMNLFGSLCKCGRCGAALTLVNKNKGYRYLVCTRARVGAGCKYESVLYSQIEDLFLYQSGQLLASIPTGTDEGAKIEQAIRNTEGNIDLNVEKLERLLTALERGGADSVTLTKRIRELEGEIVSLQQQRDDLYGQNAALSRKQVWNLAGELYDALRATPFNRAAANALMRQLFTSITLDFENGNLLVAWRHGGESDVVVMMKPVATKELKAAGISRKEVFRTPRRR
jgi:DNA invertase Pin-like site-specific DNA recombinase